MTISIALDLSFILFVVVLAIWALAKAKRAKRVQDRLIASLTPAATDSWFRINVSRPAQFAKRLKLLGFEARGLLVNSPDRIRVLAELASGETIDRSFLKSDLGLRWIGNAGIGSANMHWIAVGPADQSLMLCADMGFNAVLSREATADICRIVAPDFQLPTAAISDFALEKNPASLAAMVVFFGLLLFAGLDGVILNKNELLKLGRASWGMLAVLAFGFPAYWWLSRRQVPSRESIVLAMLIGMGFVAAYIPAVKRMDQFLAPDGATPTAYRLGPHAVLEPLAPGPPTIDYSRLPEYWQQFEEGSTHYFDLTHGPLGLWQLDHTKLDKKMRVFYQAKDGDQGGLR